MVFNIYDNSFDSVLIRIYLINHLWGLVRERKKKFTTQNLVTIFKSRLKMGTKK